MSQYAGWSAWIPKKGQKMTRVARQPVNDRRPTAPPVSKSREGTAPLAPKRSKYNAEPTTIDGIRFASKREARRYSQLKLKERVGAIHSLELQPKFNLYVLDTKGFRTVVGRYIADFSYTETITGTDFVEDAKGVKTPVYRLKKKMVEAIYGIRIIEV